MICCLHMLQQPLLLLSHFSHVWLCVTPQTADHRAPPSLGFSRQEHWSGLPFPSPMHETEKWKWSLSVVFDSSRPPGLQPTRLLCPWDFQGKSTRVECHCLLHLWSLGKSKRIPFLWFWILEIPGWDFDLVKMSVCFEVSFLFRILISFMQKHMCHHELGSEMSYKTW